ncbi:MAG: TIGR03936 family radical SAM-associated protein, partial [Clostridia bacterium]|nr:TIGR03936 family radical SAM-associated protein [Clostridia bacterium]
MSNYIIKYSRGEEVKYISHLDFIKFIQRAVRRADLPMLYSQGFNPHPQMAVALPLSVGVTSDCELMRIGFEEDYSENEVKNALNSVLPDGFSIIGVKNCKDAKIDFSAINRADYVCKCEIEDNIIFDIEKFLSSDKILVMKKSKSGIKEADIKPHIHFIKQLEIEDDIVTFSMRLDAGNEYNLKPDTVIDAMKNFDENFKVN